MRNKITNIFFLLATLLILPSFALAAPSISSVSGTVSDGNSVAISGSSFGTNSAVGTSALEFLGGKNGPIESGIVGNEFSRSGWDIDTEWGYDVSVTNNNVPWGTKVLQMTGSGDGTSIEAPLYYNLPSAVTSSDHIFLSYWELSNYTGDGQYKMLRYSPTQTIQDEVGQILWTFHNNDIGSYLTHPIESSEDEPNSGNLWPNSNPASPENTWQRFDIDITTSATTSGSINMTSYLPGSSITTSNFNNVETHFGYNWNYLVWQNYFGTDGYDDGTGNMTQGDVWLKDIYISHGTDARVELCDNASWANRQTCFVQPASAWSATGATITLNQGSFANSTTKYLYVVDSTGTANASGYAVTLGSGSSDTTPPAAPSGFSVL